jgi:hypothetical protein
MHPEQGRWGGEFEGGGLRGEVEAQVEAEGQDRWRFEVRGSSRLEV